MMNTIFLLMFYILCEVNCIDKRRYIQPIGDSIDPLVTRGELGEYFEGDMILTEDQIRALNSSEFSKNGLRDVYKRWPYNTVVYYIQENEFNFWEKWLIKNAMEDIEINSCVKFRERTYGEYAVKITKANAGCFSYVGYVYNMFYKQNEQVLNLGDDCFVHGIILHEMLHTIGFYHMQSSYNRDDYVDIIWENIEEGKENNFLSYNRSMVRDFGVPYDYHSVMHYGAWDFSKNGYRTIIPKQQWVQIGQRFGMSQSDIEKLRRMYNCYYGDKKITSDDTTTPTVLST